MRQRTIWWFFESVLACCVGTLIWYTSVSGKPALGRGEDTPVAAARPVPTTPLELAAIRIPCCIMRTLPGAIGRTGFQTRPYTYQSAADLFLLLSLMGQSLLSATPCRDMDDAMAAVVFCISVSMFDYVLCLGHHRRFVIFIENALNPTETQLFSC